MLGAIIGLGSAKIWFSSPLVQLIEGFVKDNDGVTLLMAAGLYGRVYIFNAFYSLLKKGSVSDIYINRIIKLLEAKTDEGYTADDACQDHINYKLYRCKGEEKVQCRKLFLEILEFAKDKENL